MGQSTVAVVMLNYNHARYLHESLDGICGQTRPADEIIVIDDGSTDESVRIIEHYAAKTPALRFLRNGERRGVQESIARALPLVRADYFVWTAADDRLLPQFLEKSMAVLERHPQAGLCFSETTQLKGKEIIRFATEPSVRHIFDLSDLPEFLTPAAMVKRMKREYLPLAANTVVVRRDLLLARGGYFHELEWHADHVAYVVIALRHGACVVPETLALIRATPGSYSQAMRDGGRQAVVLKAMLDLLARDEYRDIRSVFRECPSNFSPWSTAMLKAQLRSPRDWDLFFPYVVWKIREYKRGHRLSWPQTVRALSRRAAASLLFRVSPPLLAFIRAVRERDALLVQLGAAYAERDGATNALLALRIAHDTLEAQHDALAAEARTTRATLDALHAAHQTLAEDRGRLSAERDGYANAMVGFRKEYELAKGLANDYRGMLKAAGLLGDSAVDAVDQERDVTGALEAMMAEVEAGNAIFRPSNFWQHFSALNTKQLDEAGLRNFKLTANQNYHNFTPVSLFDAKARRLMRLWRRAPSLKPLLFESEPGYAKLSAANEPIPHRLVLGFSAKRMSLYRFFLALLWHYSASADRFGVLARMEEPELGNPIRVRYNGRLVSQDLATSSREFNAIMGAIARAGTPPGRLTIAELGAGYGRLAHVFTAMTPCRYLIFDIPPALTIAQWYLTTLCPDKKAFHFRRFDSFHDIEAELGNADIAFFTPNQMAKFPDGYFDLSISISSLHEMRLEQISRYLAELDRVTRDYLYIKQYYRYPNLYDGIVVERSAYRLPGTWEVLFDRPEPVYADFFEMMARKRRASAFSPDRHSG